MGYQILLDSAPFLILNTGQIQVDRAFIARSLGLWTHCGIRPLLYTSAKTNLY